MNTIEISVYKNTPVEAFVFNDYRKSDVFKKHNVYFCCGKKTPERVCIKKSIDIDELIKDLFTLEQKNIIPTNDYLKW